MGSLDAIMRYIQNTPGGGIDPFSYWGDQAKTAKDQGWYASTDPLPGDQSVVFRAPYDAPFNTVQIPGDEKLGHVAIVGRPNGKFDVVINHASGQLDKALFQGISPKDVQAWITSPDNTIAQRVNELQQKQFDPMSNEKVTPIKQVATR